MPPAARITDMHVCPMFDGPKPHVGGPIIKGMPTVVTGFMPQARQFDICTCVGPPDMIAVGSPTVLAGSLMAARMGDTTMHGGKIVTGCPTVIIGDSGSGAKGNAGAGASAGAGPGGKSNNPAAQKSAMIGASKTGAPFCEVCQKA